MILIKPSYEIIDPIDGETMLRKLEVCGRVCYKSEDRITPESYRKFAEMILKRHHESVVEHVGFSVRFIVDRGVSHELVRHRLASFSQESTRYVNYSKGQCTFIIPPWVSCDPGEYYSNGACASETVGYWYSCMLQAEITYNELIKRGWSPQQARSVLPNSTKTEIIITANLREWVHIFELRTTSAAHPQMIEVMVPLLKEIKTKIPIIFDHIPCLMI